MKKLLTTGLILGLGFLAFSQKSAKELKGDKFFEKFDYSKAINKYERLDSSITTEGLRNLAESYRLTFDVSKAEEAYSNLVQREDAKPIDNYYYAYVLKENKKYLESDKVMKKFQAQASSDDLRVKNFISNKNTVQDLIEDNGQFVINNLKINSAQEDFGTSYYNDQVVFASSREGIQAIRRKWNGNDLPFLDLYVAEKSDSSSELTNLKTLTKITNKKYHEGPASFAKEGTFMAFTKNSYTGKSADGVIKLQLFFATKNEDGDWDNLESFFLNNEEYSVGHPSLSEDGNTMYFVSDKPGGYGLADLYKVERNSLGEWGTEVNLGPKVNTEGNEMFPYYQEEEKLLFLASDGHVGLGGLDLFVSQDQSGTYNKVLNLGAPINSSTDDFAFLVDKEFKSGYFSSNRDGGKGDDDIYSFEMLKPFVFGKKLQGISKDKTGAIIANANINLLDANGKLIESIVSNEKGEYSFNVEADKNYSLTGTKSDYFDGSNKASTSTKDDVIFANLELEKDPGLALHTLVTDKKTGQALDSVTIVITDNLTGKNFLTKTTDSSGDALKGIAGKRIGERVSYNIALSRPGYFPKTVTFNSEIKQPGIIDVHKGLDLSMDQEVKDLAKLVEINPINFDLNKYEIRPDAEVELNKIVEVMNQYPNMVVELGSHTDCRASKAYNEKLSDKRAKASAEYIKQNITNPANIYGKGYGEAILLNECSCEGSQKVPCSEEKHSENRRTEFKVISTGADNVEVKNNSTDSFGK